MTHKIKARLEWVKLYEATKNAGFVCAVAVFLNRLYESGGDVFKEQVKMGLLS